MSKPSVFVTKPYLPPLQEFLPYLEQIWESKVLTNHGPIHNQFEAALSGYLKTEHIVLCNNATMALVIALKSLELEGEVITTPFSFVATSQAIAWNNLTPIFTDIDSKSFNINPQSVEAAITPKTTAILAVHCYGYPCDVNGLAKLAKKYGLKLIYDGAHAMGVNHQGRSLLDFGDLSVVSFHATKLFNTFEGGAIICHDSKTKERLKNLANFGIVDEGEVDCVGLNAKMPEVNAALGLLQLEHIESIIAKRKAVDQQLRSGLKGVSGITCAKPENFDGHNYSYFPVLVEKNYPLTRNELHKKLGENNINVRSYFSPLISELKPFRLRRPPKLDEAAKLANKVLCLPIYPDLSSDDISRIINLISEVS